MGDQSDGGSDDHLVVERLRAGDESALAEIYDRYSAEAWVHGEDLRAALARAPRALDPAHLSVLAEVGVRAFAATWAAAGDAPTADLLLRLTGPSGGDWQITTEGRSVRAPAGDVGAVVSVDCLEFCFLLVGRREVAELRHDVQGDPALARTALTAAARLARL